MPRSGDGKIQPDPTSDMASSDLPPTRLSPLPQSSVSNLSNQAVDPSAPGPPSTTPVSLDVRTSPASFAAAASTGMHTRGPSAPRRKWVFRSRLEPTAGSLASSAKRITASHGILIDSSLYRYSNKQLIDSIKVATNPNQIHSFSRIQGTFQLFFHDKSWATELIRDGLRMPDNSLVQCHSIGLPPVRVVVSDVPSDFDNADLRQIMSDFGTVVGPIRTLRAGYSDSDLPHLLSFRRQVLMKFPTQRQRETLPQRVFLEFDDNPLTFFLSTDVRCHGCRELGHVRGACPHASGDCAGPVQTADDQSVPPSTAIQPEVRVDLSPIVPFDVTHDPPASVSATDLGSLAPGPSFVGALLTDPGSACPPPPPPSKSTVLSPGKFTVLRKNKRPAASCVVTDTSKRQSLPKAGVATRSQTTTSSVLSDMDLADDISDAEMDVREPCPAPLTDSALVAFFDKIYRSPTPILAHVRQETDDPLALVQQLRRLRSSKEAHLASPLANKSRQDIYKYEKKILDALADEDA